MVRVFNVYLPIRTVLLLGGEALVVCASFVLAALIHFGSDFGLVLGYENGFYKILGVTGVALLCLYYFDLYDLQRLRSQGEIYFRILIVLGVLSLPRSAQRASPKYHAGRKGVPRRFGHSYRIHSRLAVRISMGSKATLPSRARVYPWLRRSCVTIG